MSDGNRGGTGKETARFAQHAEELLLTQRENLRRDICDLIRIKSTRGAPQAGAPFGNGPAEALRYALCRAEQMGFRVCDHRGFAGWADAGPQEPGLDILAHLDVVPGGDGWTVTDPFAPLCAGTRIYGRGAADNKGPSMAVLYALRAIVKAGAPLKKRVRIIWGCAEETGAEDIQAYYAAQPCAPMTVSPDASFPVIHEEKGRIEAHFFCPAGETSHLLSLEGGASANAVPATARALLAVTEQDLRPLLCPPVGCTVEALPRPQGYEVIVRGKAAHAASPQKGSNALAALLCMLARAPGVPRWVEGLSQVFSPSGEARWTTLRERGQLTCSLSMLRITDGRVEGVCDCRFPSSLWGTEVKTDLERALAQAGAVLSPKTTLREAHSVPPDSPFVQTLMRCYHDAGGNEPCSRIIAGNTYAHGIPGAVAFGFADPVIRTGTHGPDEYVDMEQLLFGARVYIRAILELCC